MGFVGRLVFRLTTVHEDVVEVRLSNCRIGRKSWVTSLSNVAGTLDSPWYMTNHSHNIPLGVLTAVSGMSDSRISS
ncbi:hypothetical protein PF003_g10188 [Phytophthora fragariae]|nr:hypothetical protein PF003_g10188 [Phytophthora fragariae]